MDENVKEIEILENPNQKEGKSKEIKKVKVVVIVSIIVLIALGGGLYFVYFDEPSGLTYGPGASFSPIIVMNNTSVKMTFTIFNPIPKPTDIKVVLEANETTEVIELFFPSTPTTSPFNMAVGNATNTSCTAVFIFYNNGDQVNSGDYIIIEGLQPGTKYHPMIFHEPSSTIVPWLGTNYFTTPP